MGMRFDEQAVRARHDRAPGQHRGELPLPARLVPATARQLHRMGRIEDHRKTTAAQNGKRAHVGYEIIVTESRAALRHESLSVINERGKLVGVFTDGDFRRHMATDDNLLAQPLKRVMTRRPISIRENALAVEALKIFDQRNIDDLIMVNAKSEPVGLVDSQDLPKLKLM